MTMVLGIAGSWVGSFVARAIGFTGNVGFVGAVLGAMLLLFFYRLAKRN